MGPHSWFKIPSSIIINPPVLEKKIFDFFFKYERSAIFDIWPKSHEHFRSPPHGRFSWNLASIGTVVSEENMFENVDGRRMPCYTISSHMSYGSANFFLSATRIRNFKTRYISWVMIPKVWQRTDGQAKAICPFNFFEVCGIANNIITEA